MNSKRPLRLRLWNLEAGEVQIFSLQEDKMCAGEYLGEWANIHDEGWWRWRHEITGQIKSQHLNNASEAIEWLVDRIAPCVVEARGLALQRQDSTW